MQGCYNKSGSLNVKTKLQLIFWEKAKPFREKHTCSRGVKKIPRILWHFVGTSLGAESERGPAGGYGLYAGGLVHPAVGLQRQAGLGSPYWCHLRFRLGYITRCDRPRFVITVKSERILWAITVRDLGPLGLICHLGLQARPLCSHLGFVSRLAPFGAESGSFIGQHLIKLRGPIASSSAVCFSKSRCHCGICLIFPVNNQKTVTWIIHWLFCNQMMTINNLPQVSSVHNE